MVIGSGTAFGSSFSTLDFDPSLPATLTHPYYWAWSASPGDADMSDEKFDVNLKQPFIGVAQSQQPSTGVGSLELKLWFSA